MKRLLFYSLHAFYKVHYLVFEALCADFGLKGYVITHENMEAPRVYSPKGYLDAQSAGFDRLPNCVTVLPQSLSLTEKVNVLKSKLREIRPDYIWAHVEPNEPLVNQMLRWFYFKRSPRIVVAAVENLWSIPGGNSARIAHFQRSQLWRRYDGVLASATKSMEAVRRFGMPEKVPIYIAWLPQLAPPPTADCACANFLPKKQAGEFFLGFAGRVTAAKGWKVLLAAMTMLPESFRCLIAGTGDEEAELRLLASVALLQSRVHYLGVLEREKLWDFYRALDVLALPSLTTPTWMEQFGSALAEAMACGIPVIGSNSGAIPEVIADCGLTVEENNPAALAKAVQSLAYNSDQRSTYARNGMQRFQQEFSYKVYAARVARALGLVA